MGEPTPLPPTICAGCRGSGLMWTEGEAMPAFCPGCEGKGGSNACDVWCYRTYGHCDMVAPKVVEEEP